MATARRLGSATVHGTFGELLQGYRPQPTGDYQHFLFTLPVDELYATCTVSLVPGRCDHHIRPADRTRALSAAADLARALGLGDTGITMEIHSNIPLGKGCASSTADIMASVAALVEAAHPEVPDRVVHALGSLVGREIEWGDYVFSDSIALCLQRSHTLVQEYATGMRWRIVGVDEGGSVDTAAFHRQHRESLRQAEYYETLLDQMDAALRASDSVTAGQIATESARLNQRILPKRHFQLMQRIAAATGALGIAIAHTGTVIGLLFSADGDDADGDDDVSLRICDAQRRLERENVTSRLFTVREGCL